VNFFKIFPNDFLQLKIADVRNPSSFGAVGKIRVSPKSADVGKSV
jgi:hypothetical protein